ncbi:MAG: sulfate permease [Anaerolineae bacterium]|nr:sulfate permease [Anaerolineae bacterium]
MPTAPSKLSLWFPAAVWLRQYDWGKNLSPDLIAAISVAALLIPESMGYATVAGVPVQVGLYAAPLALIGYALFGGSRLLVFGAAGSVAAVSAGIVGGLAGGDQNTAMTLTAALAFATGVLFVVAGLIRLGFVTNFMSKAVMAGFITGMSIQIIVGQFGKLLGIELVNGNTFQKLWSAISQIGDWNWTATILGVGALLLIFAMQRFLPKLPASLTAVVLSSVIIAALNPNVDLVAQIPQGLPSFTLPTGIDASTWRSLIVGGAVVILVGFSEGWGASANISKKTHDSLNTNQEFRAYGIGNIGASLLGGMVVTGSLSKSSAGMAAGAKTQMSNIFLAGMVLLTLVFFAPLFQWLPETVLAAIVINAMSGSASPRKLEKLWRIDKVDFALAFITFFLVLTLDLLPAMVVGIVLSIIYIIYRISFPIRTVLGRVAETGDYETMSWKFGWHEGTIKSKAEPVPGVIVYRFASPLVFSNANAFKETGEALLIKAGAEGSLPNTVVIDCEEMFFVDDTGADAVSEFFHYVQRYGVELSLARLHWAPKEMLQMAGVIDKLGEDRIFDTVRNAVDAATATGATKDL